MKSLIALLVVVCAASAAYAPTSHHFGRYYGFPFGYVPRYAPTYSYGYSHVYRTKRDAEPQPEAENKHGNLLTYPVTYSAPVPQTYTYTTPVKYTYTYTTPVHTYNPTYYHGSPYYFNPYYYGHPFVPAVKPAEENEEEPAQNDEAQDDAVEVESRKKRGVVLHHPYAAPLTYVKKAPAAGPSTTVLRYAAPHYYGTPYYHTNPYYYLG